MSKRRNVFIRGILGGTFGFLIAEAILLTPVREIVRALLSCPISYIPATLVLLGVFIGGLSTLLSSSAVEVKERSQPPLLQPSGGGTVMPGVKAVLTGSVLGALLGVLIMVLIVSFPLVRERVHRCLGYY